MQYICKACGYEFNGSKPRCPKCGADIYETASLDTSEVKNGLNAEKPVFDPAPVTAPIRVPVSPVPAVPSVISAEETEPAHIKSAPVVPGAPSSDTDYDEVDETITAAGFLGIFFLLLIPLIGFIFTVIWALGGCRKYQKAAFARGLLLFYLIIIALSAVAFAIISYLLIPLGIIDTGEFIKQITGLFS